MKAPIFATQGASPERRRRGRADIRGGRSRRVDLVRVRVRVRVKIRLRVIIRVRVKSRGTVRSRVTVTSKD